MADYIPELCRADPDWFGIALVSTEGHRYAVGDAGQPFTLQSVSKPFVYALALSDVGLAHALTRVGAEPSGEAFNAISLEPGTGRPSNPMINAGALIATSLVRGRDRIERFERIRACLSAFAGRRLAVDEAVFASEMETGDRNRALGYLMRSAGSLNAPVDETVEVYFRQCALMATTGDLAVMAATLANGGVNPCTGAKVVEERIALDVLSVMTTSGMYNFSGEWMLRVGLPSKSGVSGGIIAVSPGQFGVGVFSPPLDGNGNSVRGVEVLKELSNRFHLHVMHHPGRPAPVVYLSSTAAFMPSRRARSRADRRALEVHGRRIAIVAAQGEMEFAAAERLLYSIDDALGPAPVAPGWLVLDLLGVSRVHPVAKGMLDAHVVELVSRGIAVAVVARDRHSRLASSAEFREREDAIAWCEDALLQQWRREPGTQLAWPEALRNGERFIMATQAVFPPRANVMNSMFDRELEGRLLRYVGIDTQSDEKSTTSPSTHKQYDLLRLLAEELTSIGATDVQVTHYGTVLATIPATIETDAPSIAFLAHVDTAPAFTGTGVKPIVHRHYGGGDILLPDDSGVVLSPKQFPYLGTKIGDDIVTASGSTLLGADDKAGVAIVMTVARHLLQNRGVPHGTIRIGFTPDEEIGRGVHDSLPEDLKADVAYTLDGAELGEIVYETFSADKADVHVQGVSIHPGQAKDKLVNALHLAAKIVDTLPQVTLTPETTAGREGFIHVYEMRGTAASADLQFILRDFELDGLRAHGELMQQVCAAVQATEPRARITCTITKQYRNMRYWLETDMRPVELARMACRQVGIEPVSSPTRGGTDGSRLTERGIPTPNLFTGMQNIHGPQEWVSVQDMARATEVCIELARLWSSAPRPAQRRRAPDDTMVDWSG